MSETRPAAGVATKVWRFLKLFVLLVVLGHVVVFFFVNNQSVTVNLLYAEKPMTMRVVIAVSALGGVVLTMLFLAVQRIVSRRR